MVLKIILINVNKFYGKKHALQNINITIEKGMFGLLGRNGAGKTTLMKVLATLLPVNSGEINICGLPIKQAEKIRSMTGYLPQDFSMYNNMTVYEVMDYLGVLAGINKRKRIERIPSILTKVNLNKDKKTKVKALSGGMRRRLGIAQAILNEPYILIVDEPTAGLDPEERVRFRNLLCELAEDRIVILSTHIVGDIEATCENIAVMDEGSIIFQGTVNELLKRVEGKIYSARISKKDLKAVKEKYIVTGLVIQDNYVNVRFIASNEQKGALLGNAVICEANVEEAYMYLMNTKRGVD